MGRSVVVEQHPYDLPYHWCRNRFYRYAAAQNVERVATYLEGAKVLDVGCGDGYMTALIARYAASVHGIDLNEKAIAFARLIVDEPHVTFSVTTASQIPTDPVDVVTAYEVIEHLEPAERDAFLERSRQALEPRGTLVISTPNGRRAKGGNPFHHGEMAPDELREVLDAAGFGIEGLWGVYLQPPRRLEHFANTVPFRGVFRALARANGGRFSRTLLCVANP